MLGILECAWVKIIACLIYIKVQKLREADKMFKNQIKISKRGLSLLLCAILTLAMLTSLLSTPVSAVQTKRDFSGETVILGGVPFGVKFSTEGVTVIGFSDIDGISKNQNPAYLAGLRAKDVIVKVNGREIKNASELTDTVEKSAGQEITLTYKRGKSEKTIGITPIFSKSEKRYKTGIWVKDSGAGIGTMTYIQPDTKEFGGLGHGICDADTGELVRMSRGEVSSVKIHAVKKGVSGTPGELKGHFEADEIGDLYLNTECGVFGKLTTLPDGCGEKIKVAMRDEIQEGEAYIVCTLDDGVRCQYRIEISAINKNASGSKCFMIKGTDQNLISKTGGIVQGMSGSPIVQNGKLIGAVTHVMINDPTVGYGIFIENMLIAASVPFDRAA